MTVTTGRLLPCNHSPAFGSSFSDSAEAGEDLDQCSRHDQIGAVDTQMKLMDFAPGVESLKDAYRHATDELVRADAGANQRSSTS